MSALKYPVGMQTFSKIIEEGYAYVDKTAYIATLLSQGQFIFLSRPRRFGKSLLLSTLEAYFEGRRHLFKGLAADAMDLDWTPRPVFHFDFNTGRYDHPEGLVNRLKMHLYRHEEKYGVTPQMENDTALRFENLIKGIHDKTGQRVVILVDEYDKPLLEIEDHKDLYEKNQRTLKSFYSNLKSMDRYIQFAFITGVARFNNVSIFSDLNNLDDISMVNTYADICGWSEDELLHYFRQGIEYMAEEREEDFEETLRQLRDFYDGYRFTLKGSRLYNPFSVLKALNNKEIDYYWFSTGTPTFLVKRIKARGTFPPDINGKKCSRKELSSVGLNDNNPLPLMFQTGYLTIADYDKMTQLYELRFSNQEVETGFYDDLLRSYLPDTTDPESPFYFTLFKTDLTEGRPKDFMERLKVMLKALPYEDHNEPTYRAVTYLIAVLSGNPSIAEHHGYRGRSDLEVFAGKNIYIFEFKYNKSVAEALEQIKDRDYGGRYAMDPRQVYLIGANFIENKDVRSLEYEIKTLRQV